MEDKEYKYDVAFSLLDADLALAQEINDLLADRYKTFLYSERQKDIAGTDGEIKFKEIFSKEARIVVVFYRENWGKTPWTRMEEEAIRGRAYEEGYDFVKFIPLDDNHKVPVYLPKVQIWINATMYGAKGVASVIEARLSELGVAKSKESTVEKAARLDRQIAFEKAKKAYGYTTTAIQDAQNSFSELTKLLEQKTNEIKALESLKDVSFKAQRYVVVLLGLPKSLKVEWQAFYSNSLDDSSLEISLWTGHPPYPNVGYYKNPVKRESIKMTFELTKGNVGMWVDSKGNAYDAASLADYVLHYYLDNGSK